MSKTGERVYDESKSFLNSMGFFISAGAEQYADLVASNLVHSGLIPEEYHEAIRALYLLKAADYCATRNLDRPILNHRFLGQVVLNTKDVQVVVITSFCNPLRKRKCSRPKNNVIYLATFSGEAERIRRVLQSSKATDLLKLGHDEGAIDSIQGTTGDSPEVSRLMTIKSAIWFKIAQLIQESPISEFNLEDDFREE